MKLHPVLGFITLEFVRIPAFSVSFFPEMLSNRAAISPYLHALVRGPSLTGLGKRPLLQPAHQELRLTGMRARTWGKRKSEFSEMFDNMTDLRVI